jgi:hypothetical protein
LAGTALRRCKFRLTFALTSYAISRAEAGASATISPNESQNTIRIYTKKLPACPWLPKKAERGFYGYPIATIAFYGPTDKLATKVAVSIILTENHEPDLSERWFSDSGLDVRHDPAIGEQHITRPYVRLAGNFR